MVTIMTMFGTLIMARSFFLILFVDDMLIAYRDMSKVKELKEQLGREFDMKDLGVAQKIIGVEIRKDRKVGKL